MKQEVTKFNTGHYLDRLIAICDDLGMSAESELLLANKRYLYLKCKPDGLNELIFDFSCAVIVHCEALGRDITPYVWGLDINALKTHNLTHLRD